MSEPNQINRIFLEDNLTVTPIATTSLVFSGGRLLPRITYSISDHIVTLTEQVSDFLAVNYFQGKTDYFEYRIRLYSTKVDRSISVKGVDVNNRTLQGLLSGDTIMIFANGRKLSKNEYEIISDGQVKLYVEDTTTQYGTVIICISPDIVDLGKVTESSSYNSTKRILTLPDQTINRYLFFLNGELVDRRHITFNIDGTARFDFEIKDSDILEYYRLPLNNANLVFDEDPGFFSYGPKDIYNTEVPDIYDAIITFDKHIARLAIDDLRKGFFVREVDTDGCLMIVDDDFEHFTLKCLTISNFKAEELTSTEYYIQVPNAKSITYYLSHFDLSQKLLPELLTTFQTLLLNETYDSIQRLKNTRSLTKIDSDTINQLITFLGFNQKLTDMPLEQKHALLEELNNFYRKVGTRTSYNFYNIIAENSKIIDIQQLFTPIKDNSEIPDWTPHTAYASGRSTMVKHEGNTYYCIKSHVSGAEFDPQFWTITLDDNAEKRYVTFYNQEDLGAEYKQEYQFPFDDYGRIGQLANATDILSNYPHALGRLQNPERKVYCYANDDGTDLAYTAVVMPTGEWSIYSSMDHLTEDDWQPNTFYYKSQFVIVDESENYYCCKTDHTSAETWEEDADNWLRIVVKPEVKYAVPNGFLTDTVVGPNVASEDYDYGYVFDFEYNLDLSKGFTLIEGEDMYGNELSDLRPEESQVYINAKKLQPDEYQILSSNLLLINGKYNNPQTIFMHALNFTPSNPSETGYASYYYVNALNLEDNQVYTAKGDVVHGQGTLSNNIVYWKANTHNYLYYVLQNGQEVVIGSGTREGLLDTYIRSDTIQCPYASSLWAFTGNVKTEQDFDVSDYTTVRTSNGIIRLTNYTGSNDVVIMPNGQPQERTYYINPEATRSKTQSAATAWVLDSEGNQIVWGPNNWSVMAMWYLNENGTQNDIILLAINPSDDSGTLIGNMTRNSSADLNTEKENENLTKVIIWKSSQTPTNIYDYGSVAEQIKGEWVEWFEWDRPAGWYPTNHVDVSLEIPSDVDYDTFITEFKNTFYDIASTVLYIHSIINVYTFACGENNFGIMTAPTYHTIQLTLANNHREAFNRIYQNIIEG